ncbi:hypothetical protein T459_00561 [Capsicum annuum]|uniref:Uncharacterized protein n=1 Tax=Capsicum annuum TaxID=4072 RepID=A0A2G3AEL8_CAPAN|nr:hypothetical protein T459_00561 [Capsicum annuum]
MGMDREGGSSGSCNYFGTSTGSGQISKDKYYYGFFNAALKLPAHFTFGAVVAFYATFNTPGGFNEKKYQNNCGQPSQRWLLTGPVRMVNDDLSVEHMSQELHPVLEYEKKASQQERGVLGFIVLQNK